MYKTTVIVDGMMCKNCENHVNESIKKAFPDAKKVESSHKSGLTTFMTDDEADEGRVSKAIGDAGYEFVSSESVPC